MKRGTLYIVSTPIGNLDDITLRALNVLKEVDVIAAEDTRHSRKLLTHFGISKRLISYWGEKEKAKSEEVLRLLHEGRNVALISDSGTPGISDPGEVLIRKAIESSISLVPVPGPSAVVTALIVSGMSTKEFVFLGFVPPKKSERYKFLEKASVEKRTVVFYESPHRLLDCLDDLSNIIPDRNLAVCHEMTKLHESVVRGTVSEVLVAMEDSKIAGEYVLVIEGAPEERVSIDQALIEVEELMKEGTGRKEAVRRIADKYGLSKKKLYDLSLSKE